MATLHWLIFVTSTFSFASSLRCLSSECTSPGGPCPPPTMVTCTASNPSIPMAPDRCTVAIASLEPQPGTVMEHVTRGCAYSFYCASAKFRNTTCDKLNTYFQGIVTSCDVGCCHGDMCNNGTLPKRDSIWPTGSDLSCYSCSSRDEPASCENPVTRSCGVDAKTNTTHDRCVTAIISEVEDGARRGYQVRDCGNALSCAGNLVCSTVNKTRKVTGCDVSCCYGENCNNGNDVVTTIGGATVVSLTCDPSSMAFSNSGNHLRMVFSRTLVVLVAVVALFADPGSSSICRSQDVFQLHNPQIRGNNLEGTFDLKMDLPSGVAFSVSAQATAALSIGLPLTYSIPKTEHTCEGLMADGWIDSCPVKKGLSKPFLMPLPHDLQNYRDGIKEVDVSFTITINGQAAAICSFKLDKF
ncbi:uncharacterized protein LOC116611541 isoform X2 [Nematostella vectensis]|uniref:uncharacterized protein LOC116611541 isoform X2 n=1 Tax=Nematostella vectensis TaxID=45351 RepID=UPI0020771D22|nr:uncharacterized protein LOC116611541 isoform X2 [Nematostella vectensis]